MLFARTLKFLAHACVAAAMPLSGALAKPDLTKLERQDITVRASKIASFGPSADGRRYGGLIFRGGLQLSSSSAAFGGFSGLRLAPDGKAFIAVSDAGFWMRGAIAYDGRTPARITNTEIGPLRALSGAVLTGNSEIDAEGIEILGTDVRKSAALISFERIHRIGRFQLTKDGISKPSRYLKLPPQARILKSNRGLETIAQFKAGRLQGTLIYFAEGRRDARGKLRGWLRAKTGKTSEVFVEPIRGFDITDATALPSGDLVLLERRFRYSEGVKMRLRLIRAQAIRPGAVLNGTILFEADQTYRIDNMEGVSAHRSKLGRTILSVISDDNFNFFQRTLLLQFVISEDVLGKKPIKKKRS